MNAQEIVLVDLSSIAHPIWHTCQSEPDPNTASQRIVARIRALASQHPHAAICCDSGRSFRRDVSSTYKGNRPDHDAVLQHQIDLAREELAADGFPIWAVRGFEADDLIATATREALALDNVTVLIVSADKDLLQLVGPRVKAMIARDGSVLDAEAVKAKFGVLPEQMCDYLCLVGDASDNVKGATGVGPKKAADLLDKYGSLEHAYFELTIHGSDFKPAIASALQEFRQRMDDVRTLITLRTDVDLPFSEVIAERIATQQPFGDEEQDMDSTQTEETQAETIQPSNDTAAADGPATPAPTNGLAVREPDVTITPAPAEWERQLDPRSMKDAIVLSKDLHASRLFSAYGTPQAVLSTIMLGRELGLPAMGSLRSIHIIEGRHALAASLMVALVLKSGLAEYFEPVSFDEQQATFTTLRKGARNPVTLQHTVKMAETAGLLKRDSNWLKIPGDMVVARAQSRLARMVFPDLLAGLYTPDELADIRESTKAA